MYRTSHIIRRIGVVSTRSQSSAISEAKRVKQEKSGAVKQFQARIFSSENKDYLLIF